MTSRTASTIDLDRRARIAIVWVVAAAIVAAAFLAPPYAQPQEYHRFADQRAVPDLVVDGDGVLYLCYTAWTVER